MSGIAGLPQSRRCANDQSSVRMIAFAPAWRARSRICSTRSREPIQYIWKNSVSLAAITSSIGLLANELRPIAVPAPAAARATATSPSGCTACTPVGEISTGSASSCPRTVVPSAGARGPVAIRGKNPSSRKAATLSSTVTPASAPASSAP